MDAAGSERAFIIGFSEGGCMACVFAATYPQRTRGLLLWGTMPRWVQAEGFPWGFPLDEHQRIVAEVAEHGVPDEYLTGAGAGAGEASDKELAGLKRYFRASASPTQLATLERMNQDMDIRDILPAIRVPTLVLNRVADPVAPIEAVRQMAAEFPVLGWSSFLATRTHTDQTTTISWRRSRSSSPASDPRLERTACLQRCFSPT
jgi:pimeloyl-ACP methyl ester carboxylesterase